MKPARRARSRPGPTTRQRRAWTNQILNPVWVQTGVTSQDAGTSKSWSVEVSIPISAAADPAFVPIPASGLFGLYFNIIRLDGHGRFGATDGLAGRGHRHRRPGPASARVGNAGRGAMGYRDLAAV
ncbi:MAG: hypothetical protein MZW92_40805 [Comamonadaceae bacterium]|nr:hypothetical protein [Comamonadaceae bacterium]